MKNQNRKLNLNKRTITNLGMPELNKIAGGQRTGFCDTERLCTRGCGGGGGGQTRNGNTCPGHNTCNA
jgi:hypothetical protein